MTIKKKSEEEIKEQITEKEVVKEKTTADLIWADLKNKQIDMFALPFQTVSMYCQPIGGDPNRLYLNYKVGSILPAMEKMFSNKYNFELVDKYIVVSKKG